MASPDLRQMQIINELKTKGRKPLRSQSSSNLGLADQSMRMDIYRSINKWNPQVKESFQLGDSLHEVVEEDETTDKFRCLIANDEDMQLNVL